MEGKEKFEMKEIVKMNDRERQISELAFNDGIRSVTGPRDKAIEEERLDARARAIVYHAKVMARFDTDELTRLSDNEYRKHCYMVNTINLIIQGGIFVMLGAIAAAILMK